jgi:integrase
MGRARSGSHLLKRGEIYWYRRVVPKECRAAFGVSEVTKSLDTTSEIEAKRLEKEHDVRFEDRLSKARDEANPEKRTARIACDIIEAHPKTPHMAQWATAYLAPEDREPVREITGWHFADRAAYENEIAGFTHEIGQLLREMDPQRMPRYRAGILSVLRHQVGPPLPASTDGSYTLEWAYSRWLRIGGRTAESVKTGRRHFDAFVEHSKLIMLDQVRRTHLMAWRDSLVDTNGFATNSINQRLQLVSAILRAGWRDAEMAEQNLKALILANSDDNDRGSWNRTEILSALKVLEPRTWSAWLYLIGLTTGVRMGEPVAARVDWFDHKTSMIEVLDRKFTKAKKLHCMPIIPMLREPLMRLIGNRPTDDYLFVDAPRPANPNIGISHETSKWMGRFFRKHKIDRVFHELRDTWIEAAKCLSANMLIPVNQL